MIKVSKITKKYDDFMALDDVSFQVEEGKITGFLGPNGAGKTTTMRILTGYLSADQGEVDFDGDNMRSSREKILSDIGYLPENNPLYKTLRVDEFLLFCAKVKQYEDYTKLNLLAEQCGLSNVLNKQISSLSKGYKQRVGLAKALIGDPKYLILDEPTTGLDPNQKDEILNLIKSISKNKTILFSSHALDEVKKIADKIIIINQGKIAAQGKADILAKQHLKVAKIDISLNVSLASLKEILKDEKFIKKIKKVGENEKFNKFELEVDSQSDNTLKLFKIVVKNKWEMIELHEEVQSLENLFKQLTK